MAATLETDIYDDLYGDSENVDSKETALVSPTEEQPANTPGSESLQEEPQSPTVENGLPARPELSYSAQIAQQFSAYKQTPAQERQPLRSFSSSTNAGDDAQGSQRRPVRPSEMKDEGKLFIGGLSWDTSDEGLRNYFSEFGEVEDCTILRDHDGRSRGFAFLTFKDPSSVNAVMTREHVLDGKTIDPKRAIPREEHMRNTRYFVGGLSHATTSETMKSFFSAYGKVVDATVMVDRDTGRSKGFGFVTFEDASNTDQLVGKGLVLDDKEIEVKVAQPRSQRDREAAMKPVKPAREAGVIGVDTGSTPSMPFNGMMNTAMNPQNMAMFYQRMMGQMPMAGGMPMTMGGMGMGMNGFAGGNNAMTGGMMPMGPMSPPMNQIGDFGGLGGNMGGQVGGQMGGGMNGNMSGGMSPMQNGMNGSMGGGMMGGMSSPSMGGMGGMMGAGMRMGMGPMSMGQAGMNMRPYMGNPMMRQGMGMMAGGMSPMGRARGGGMMNAGVGPARNMVRGQHGFHPYAR